MTNISFTGTPCLLSPHNMDGKNCIDFLFFNVHFCNLLVECAYKCGNKLKTEANTSRVRFAKWKDLTIPELKVFIGIILFMRTVNYWSTNYLMRLSPPLFMARDRYYLILRALNVQTDERPESIFKIKLLIDLFNQSMCYIYYPSKKIAIDESLILWKGRLSFRQYLKGKRHRYILADVHGIIQKIYLYAGSGDQLVGGRNHLKK